MATETDARTNAELTYEQYAALVLPDAPAHLRFVNDDLLYADWMDGVSVNDAIVKRNYWAACRKVDRNY